MASNRGLPGQLGSGTSRAAQLTLKHDIRNHKVFRVRLQQCTGQLLGDLTAHQLERKLELFGADLCRCICQISNHGPDCRRQEEDEQDGDE